MNQTDRRTFLRSTLGATAGALFIAQGYAQMSRKTLAGASRPCAPTAWRKHGVILEASEPWEGDGIQSFTSPAEPLADGAWRIWYTATGRRGIAFAEGVPGGPMKKFPAQCSPGEPLNAPFAVGNLPEGWRPVQVVHVPLRHGKHRIYFWAHGPQILRYLAADSDDGRRYRVIDPLRPCFITPTTARRRAWLRLTASCCASRKHGAPCRGTARIVLLISNAPMLSNADGTLELYSWPCSRAQKRSRLHAARQCAGLAARDRPLHGRRTFFDTRTRIIQRDAQDPVDQQFIICPPARRRLRNARPLPL